jgi:hypothetical protein
LVKLLWSQKIENFPLANPKRLETYIYKLQHILPPSFCISRKKLLLFSEENRASNNYTECETVSLLKALKFIKSKKGIITYYKPLNALIVTDVKDSLIKIKKFIKYVDKKIKKIGIKIKIIYTTDRNNFNYLKLKSNQFFNTIKFDQYYFDLLKVKSIKESISINLDNKSGKINLDKFILKYGIIKKEQFKKHRTHQTSCFFILEKHKIDILFGCDIKHKIHELSQDYNEPDNMELKFLWKFKITLISYITYNNKLKFKIFIIPGYVDVFDKINAKQLNVK